MLEIKTDENPILRQKCQPIEKFDDELRFLVKEMLKTMYANEGIGLAGPQVGELKNLFVFDAEMKCVYRGQFDSARPGADIEPTGEDLSAALDAVLTGEPVNEQQTPSMGCNIKWRPILQHSS